MKNFNLRIKLKSGKINEIYHVDDITFDTKFAKNMAIHSYGLTTYVNTENIEIIEVFTSNY